MKTCAKNSPTDHPGHGVLVALSSALALGYGLQDSKQVVPGPEAKDLLAQTSGVIVMTLPVGGIQTVQFPSLTLSNPREPDKDRLPVHSVAGPDSRGRIALIENDMLKKRHSLELLNPDGREVSIFEREGDALWENAVGEYLAFDASGRRVAFVARAEGIEAKSPDAYLVEGELEIWDVEKRECLGPKPRALDDTIAWFPDGKQLVYTALIAHDEAEKLLRVHVGESDDFGRATLAWKRVPVVQVLDVETGESRALHAGERPILSTDGHKLLVRDFELHWRLLDLEAKISKSVTAPGAIYPGAIAFVDPNTVLYWAWPTEGSEPESTKNNSPVVGMKQMRTLKLVDLRDGHFQTVVPAIDPRRRVSFGPGIRDGK